MLMERISGLSGMVAGVDARPPAQAYDVYRMFAAELQRQLLALRAALGGDLQAVNAALRAASLSRIVPKAAELRRPPPGTAQELPQQSLPFPRRPRPPSGWQTLGRP